MSFKKYGWAIQKSLLAKTNQNSTFSHTHENSKMLNVTSKYSAFLTINHLQAESRIKQGIYLHVFPVCIIILCFKHVNAD